MRSLHPKRQGRRRLLTIMMSATLLSGTAVAVSGTAQAAAPEATQRQQASRLLSFKITGTGKAAPLSPEEEQDARTLAKSEGKAVEQVLADARGQTEWSKLINQVRESDPDNYVNASRQTSESSAFITLVRTPSEEVQALLKQLPYDITVRSGSPASSDQLERIAGTAISALIKTGLVSEAVSSKDQDTSAIAIEYQPIRGAAATVEALTSIAVNAAQGAVGGELPVPVRLVEKPNLGLELVYAGGASLWDGTTFACTSGFNVRDTAAGGTGTVTAQHCPNGLRWGESKQTGVIQYVKAAPSVSAGKIDLQYHKSINGESGSANFQATGGAADDRRTVSSGSNATFNDGVCKWGWGRAKAGGSYAAYDCATVVGTDDCIGTNDGTYCGINTLNKAMLNGGDSGGPAFTGTIARGYNEAVNPSDNRSYYTQVSRLRYMDLAVVTG